MAKVTTRILLPMLLLHTLVAVSGCSGYRPTAGPWGRGESTEVMIDNGKIAEGTRVKVILKSDAVVTGRLAAQDPSSITLAIPKRDEVVTVSIEDIRCVYAQSATAFRSALGFLTLGSTLLVVVVVAAIRPPMF